MPVIAVQPKPGQILNISSPLTHCRFEWHPLSARVYILRTGTIPIIGDPIATDIIDHGSAINAVLIFCRGYREAQAVLSLGAKV